MIDALTSSILSVVGETCSRGLSQTQGYITSKIEFDGFKNT